MSEEKKLMEKSFDRFRESLGRKVEEWKNIPTLNTKRYLDTVTIYTLPTFTTNDLGIKNTLDTFKLSMGLLLEGEKLPQWFVLERGWGRGISSFIVNTEGYDYCRYMARIGTLAYKEDTPLTNIVKTFG